MGLKATLNDFPDNLLSYTSDTMVDLPAIDYSHLNPPSPPRPCYNYNTQQHEEEDKNNLPIVDFSRLTLQENNDGMESADIDLDQHSTRNVYAESPVAPCDSHSQYNKEQKQRQLEQNGRNLLLFMPDKDGDTALHISIAQENNDATLQIIKRAPDFTYLNVINYLQQTPLHIAALTNSSTIVRKLICAGADVWSQDRNGNTPLHLACFHGHTESIKQLITPIQYTETLENAYPIPFAGIPQDIHIKNCDGQTCLHLAVIRGDLNVIRLLLKVDADPNCGESKSGKTALHLAAEQNACDVVSLLLDDRLTEVDALNYAGHSPAMLAYSRGHLDIVKLLLKNGAAYGFCLN